MPTQVENWLWLHSVWSLFFFLFFIRSWCANIKTCIISSCGEKTADSRSLPSLSIYRYLIVIRMQFVYCVFFIFIFNVLYIRAGPFQQFILLCICCNVSYYLLLIFLHTFFFRLASLDFQWQLHSQRKSPKPYRRERKYFVTSSIHICCNHKRMKQRNKKKKQHEIKIIQIKQRNWHKFLIGFGKS